MLRGMSSCSRVPSLMFFGSFVFSVCMFLCVVCVCVSVSLNEKGIMACMRGYLVAFKKGSRRGEMEGWKFRCETDIRS